MSVITPAVIVVLPGVIIVVVIIITDFFASRGLPSLNSVMKGDGMLVYFAVLGKAKEVSTTLGHWQTPSRNRRIG